MHDIWNPWHGCIKCSEGCEHCYMYFLDRQRGMDGSEIFRTKNFDYPLQTNRKGQYKIKSGEQLRVCMTSDFFLPQADEWRPEAWEIMRRRKDVIFFILTKRPQRVERCLPPGWDDGWDNVFFNVTCENQQRADERIPILLHLPFKHKGIMCAPLIGNVSIKNHVKDNSQIQQVICGGENYDGSRVCDFEWVKSLRHECVRRNIRFCFIETGTRFRKDGKIYTLPSKGLQSLMAYKSGMNFEGEPLHFHLCDEIGFPIPPERLHVPYFKDHCGSCGSQMICNGCSNCGKCGV